MADLDQIKTAIGCLGTVYPQFVSKELSQLTDSVFTAVQGFTDPLASIADLNIDSVISGVADLSEGDVFNNLGSAAIGLTSQYVAREAKAYADAKLDSGSSTAKRIQQVQKFSESLVSSGFTMFALFNDMPYAIAQRMCRIVSRIADLKVKNLQCLRSHMVQLTNCVLVLLKNKTFKDDTLSDLQTAKDLLRKADVELARSQPTNPNGSVGFDQNAFLRARELLVSASGSLTPDKDGTSILDAVDILTSDSVDAGQVNRSNAALVHIVIPSLIILIKNEIAAVLSHAEIINFHINQLAKVISEYRNTANSSRVRAQRSRAIFEIRNRLRDMCSAMELALDRGSIKAASGQMLLWSSRVKTMIAEMNELNQVTLSEGSPEGPDKAFVLEEAFQQLLRDLANIDISVDGLAVFVDGIEDPLFLREKVLALTLATERIVSDIEQEKISDARLAALHAQMATVAKQQAKIMDASISGALRQKAICDQYNQLDIQTGERYEQLLDSMRQVGMDRAVDLLSSGQLEEFVNIDLGGFSYLGAAINCLTDALGGIDDVQTRRSIINIRDDMVARRANLDLAAADSSDQGRTRLIERLGEDIKTIQKNAKTVEAIVDELKSLVESAGGLLEESFGSINTFLGNIDQLNVKAGGHLSSVLESVSDFPNAGVVECDPP